MRHLTFLFCLFFFAHAASGADKLPIEAFGSLPDVSHVSLSPDGRYLASLVRVDMEAFSGQAVSVLDLASGERHFPLSSENETYTIYRMHWANDDTLLVRVYYPTSRLFTTFGAGRVPTRETNMYIVDVKTGDVKHGLSRNFLRRTRITPVIRDNIIDMLPDDPEHILISVTENSPNPQVYRLNLNNRAMRVVQRSRPGVYSWHTDRQHRVRVAVARDDTTFTVSARNPDGDDWRDLWQFEAFSEDEVWPMGFGADPQALYVSAYHDGLNAVFRVDLKDPQLARELVYANPDYDVDGSLYYSEAVGDVVGIRHGRGQAYTFWHPDYVAFQAAIDQALPDTSNYFYSFTADDNQYILMATNDTDAGTYYLGNREARALNAVALRYGRLPLEAMRPKQRFDYPARDELAIEGFLTLPATEEATGLPTIVFPHGGPIAEDRDDFDPWVQFFANRGYAVLQMNFRGSAGRGQSFRNLGLANWGHEMQDDIEDGARALIEAGIADPERICIVGASYGGYAALMGAVKTPDFYRCAISINGVSDVLRLSRDFSDRSPAALQLGQDRRNLRNVSPVNHAEKFQVPVLLIHADQDRQVPPEHSRRMHQALERADKDVTYVELENEDHFLSNGDNRLITFRAVDEFLRQHLPVGPSRQAASAPAP